MVKKHLILKILFRLLLIGTAVVAVYLVLCGFRTVREHVC